MNSDTQNSPLWSRHTEVTVTSLSFFSACSCQQTGGNLGKWVEALVQQIFSPSYKVCFQKSLKLRITWSLKYNIMFRWTCFMFFLQFSWSNGSKHYNTPVSPQLLLWRNINSQLCYKCKYLYLSQIRQVQILLQSSAFNFPTASHWSETEKSRFKKRT